MSKIENLIKELCPGGVPMVKLGEVCEVSNGERPPKNVEEGPYPYINAGTTASGSFNVYNSEANAVTTPSHGEGGIGFVGFQSSKFWCGALCFRLYANTNIIHAKYLYHILSQNNHLLLELKKEGGVPYFNKKQLQDIQIPLPPLDVQKEIVRILDKFSAMVENLDKEIELRQKQYEYYREKLLSPPTPEGGEWELKTLGELGTFVRGNGLQKADFREEGYPCIHYGQVHTYYGTVTTSTKSYCDFDLAEKLKKVPTGGLIIATTSEDVEACCKAVVWLGEGEVAYSGDSFGYIHNQNPKYMAYLFQTEMFAKQKRMVAIGAKVVRVSGDSMAKFEFLFPPLARQQEIVDTLDKFEAMIANLKEERALRQKQYEYYREKLLTFN